MSPNPPPERIADLPAPPARPADSHKGTYGRVLIIGGSRGMSGAACLAGLGALRGGAGLVYLAVPESVLPIVAAVEPSYLTIPLPEDENGRLSRASWDRLAPLIPDQTAVAIGPGWGQSDELTEFARRLYTEVELPLVVDADGLNALAKSPEILVKRPERDGQLAPRILTPHPGEFSRLAGVSIGEIHNHREDLAVTFAREHRLVMVLKGDRTLVTDGARLYENTTGNPGMATGGTGDVLTGLVAALAAQGMAAFEAAQFGVYLHGLAGDLAAEELSQPGLIASDLPRYLALAWKESG
jgi:ADP-dependent NAD(P)H-hydrate dehydratase